MAYHAREPGLSELKTAERLSIPLPMSYFPSAYLDCRLSRFDAAEVLGPPMLTSWMDGLGMMDLWGFEYPCGLRLAFQFPHTESVGGILFDSPEVEHAMRHLPFHEADVTPMTPEIYDYINCEIVKTFPDRRPEIAQLKAFQVRRIDDNGNVFAVGDPTSERDARCLVQEYEARGHKQMYWVAPAQ